MKGQAKGSQKEEKIGRILLSVKPYELVMLLEPQLLRAITMLESKDYLLIINMMLCCLDLFTKKDFDKLHDI